MVSEDHDRQPEGDDEMNEDDVEEERERLVENWMELCGEGERRIYGDEEGEVTAPVGD
jgi:hypothetical protein